jgi:enoyl-CoA hydratase/carnithine racemase
VTSSDVLVAVKANVGSITLNRPEKRNALTREMLETIIEALRTFALDSDIRVVLFRGVGNSFCAGLDLADMKSARDEQGSFDYELLPEVFSRVALFPMPTIAMVHGPAIAGGCELALHCDLRIGSPKARFAMPLAKLGLVIPTYAAERLIQTIGLTAARDMLLSGDAIDGGRAERIGLLSRLSDEHDLESTTNALVQSISKNAPLSLRAMKRVLDGFAPRLSEEAQATLDAERLQISCSEDMREGLLAFFERRAPVFRGV